MPMAPKLSICRGLMFVMFVFLVHFVFFLVAMVHSNGSLGGIRWVFAHAIA